MITIKSDREIALMREAGNIAMLAHEEIRKAIKPGVSTKELDKIAYDVITKHGAMNSLRDVQIEDLLGREPVHLDNKNINSLIKNTEHVMEIKFYINMDRVLKSFLRKTV